MAYKVLSVKCRDCPPSHREVATGKSYAQLGSYSAMEWTAAVLEMKQHRIGTAHDVFLTYDELVMGHIGG